MVENVGEDGVEPKSGKSKAFGVVKWSRVIKCV